MAQILLKISIWISVVAVVLCEAVAFICAFYSSNMLTHGGLETIVLSAIGRSNEIGLIRRVYQADIFGMTFVMHFLAKWFFCASILETLLLIAARLKAPKDVK